MNSHHRKTALVSVEPGKKINLKAIDPESSGDYTSKLEPRERLVELHEAISEFQRRLYAESRQSLLIVMQAMDTGGKDGALKSLFTGINPAGVRETSFKAPNATELEHDFLWRIHAAAPAQGYIGVWNRSHYEDVLAVRVRKLAPEKVWRPRYEQINNFEEILHEGGTTILKFFLHISKDEQKKRLQARLDNPEKHWKFNPSDLDDRKMWDEYQEAYEDALTHCSTKIAPWHIVPANKKWARDIAIAEIVAHTLEKMDPQYPEDKFDASKIVIE